MTYAISKRRVILADTIGLVVLAIQVACLTRWLAPDDGFRILSGTLSYLVLVTGALAFWHHEKLAKNLSEAKQWVKFGGGSILLGAVSFCFDMLIGTILHPSSSPLDAATKAGGPFGIGLTVLFCPGLTAVAVAGLTRSLLLQRQGI